MKLDFSIDTRQTQKLHLTKELRQAIEILQMNSQEVELLIAEELNENPVLEAQREMDIDWAKFVTEVRKNASSKKYNENEYHEQEVNPDNFVGGQVQLYDHLVEEISSIMLTKREQQLAYFLIERVNDSGYLLSEIEDCAMQMNASTEEMESVLHKIQNIEPAGLLARNLKECLLLQIGPRTKKNELLYQMISNDLEDIAQKKYAQLQKKYKISEVKLKEIIGHIRLLDPKPGKRFSSFLPSYVLPDVIVEKNGDRLEILDNSTLPRLYISDFYQKVLSETNDEEAKEYIKTKLNRAVALIRNIEQRKKTIHRVAEQILKHQQEFFHTESSVIVPMRLKDISAETGFHESTISRAVKEKYMLTPKGLFEFRYFFATALNTQSGEDVSSKSIKDAIKKLIKSEDKTHPLSDQKICDLLQGQGVQISRRTVAKYREEMQLAGSSQRKEL